METHGFICLMYSANTVRIMHRFIITKAALRSIWLPLLVVIAPVVFQPWLLRRHRQFSEIYASLAAKVRHKCIPRVNRLRRYPAQTSLPTGFRANGYGVLLQKRIIRT